jgi:hypothetical protein
MTGRELFDPYALETVDLDDELEQLEERAPTTAPTAATTPAAPAASSAPSSHPLARTRFGEGAVVRLLAVARRSAYAAPSVEAARLELAALRLELLAWVALAGADLDVRNLVRELAPKGEPRPELVEQLDLVLERAERVLPKLERGEASSTTPKRRAAR